MNQLLLDALLYRNTSRPPVWLMRQAGRYMPEYRAIREKRSFLEMVKNPEVAAQVTLLPIDSFGVDAAILFSDILVVPEALGVGLHFKEKEGPVIERPVTTVKEVETLPKIDVEEKLGYVKEAIKVLLPELKVPLIGFAGAPFTVASYMVEGGSSGDFKKTKQWMLRDPVGFHQLLCRITECTIDYLKMQIGAGVQALQIFDSWAHVLGHRQFGEFSLAYLKKIVKELEVPVILFCRGSSVFASELAEAESAAISIDWNGDLAAIRSSLADKIALQGNLDPDILYAPQKVIREEVNKTLESMRGDPGYIFNLGHGIKPDMSVDAVRTLVETVQNFR